MEEIKALKIVNVLKALDWCYDRVLSGFPGTESAIELAESYQKDGLAPLEITNSLIKFQNAKAGASGFILGLGGAISMPIAIPANLLSVWYVQMRMIAAIAHIGGYDIKDDRVKTVVYVCMTGNASKDVLKNVGIVIGSNLLKASIKNISGKTISAINKKIGFKLLTKFGEKGAINLGKVVPIAGGIIGGTVDAIATNIVGKVARSIFINNK